MGSISPFIGDTQIVNIVRIVNRSSKEDVKQSVMELK